MANLLAKLDEFSNFKESCWCNIGVREQEVPGWLQGGNGFSNENPSPGAVNVCQASFRCERDEEPLPTLLVRSRAAKPVLSQALCMSPGSDLVERSDVSEDDQCIYGTRCRKVGCQPPLEAVIISHLALVRLRVSLGSTRCPRWHRCQLPDSSRDQ